MHDIVITPCSVYMYFSLQNGDTALMKASSGGYDKCVKLLLNISTKFGLQNHVSAVDVTICFTLAFSHVQYRKCIMDSSTYSVAICIFIIIRTCGHGSYVGLAP